MGERRTFRSSDNDPAEYHAENCKGRSYKTHEGSRLRFLCLLCISIVLIFPHWSSAAEEKDQCMPHCWKKESADIKFNDGLFLKGIDKESTCKDLCLNNETCIGVYFGFNSTLKISSCWFQMPNTGDSESLTNSTHWILSDCSDDCQPYCWKEKRTNVQIMGSVLQNNISTENDCKVVCANNQTCNGADWNNTDNRCRLVFTSTLTQVTAPDPVHHWEILRNLSTNCSQSTTQAGASASDNETVSSELLTNETLTETNSSTVESEAVAEETSPAVDIDLSLESTTETEETQPAAILIVGNTAPSLDRGTAKMGESRVEKSHLFVGMDADCDCPDYMIGIISMAAMMALLVLIIIGLIAFIISMLRSEQSPSYY